MHDLLKYDLNPEYEYKNVLILDKRNSIERSGDIFSRVSIGPMLRAGLIFYQMPNGGMKCLKDRYDFYGKDNIFFAE
jgi:hypothetical protein